MAVEPVLASSAIALRPGSGDIAFLAALGAGESLDATVIARLADGSLRLALSETLFAEGGSEATADGTPTSTRTGIPQAPGGRAAPAPDGAVAARSERQAATPPPAESLAASPPQRAPDARRPALLDLPASSGLKPGDQVRLTILHPAPELSVGVHLRAPVHAATREDAATGATRPGDPATEDTPLAQRAGGSLRLPAGPRPDGAPVPVRVRDSVTLSPGATLLVESFASEEAPAGASRPEPTPEGRAAVAALIPKAAAGQGSLAPLLANAEAMLRLPTAAALPSPVREALRMLIATGVDATTLDAASLRTAVAQSGPFFEAALVAPIRKAINAAVQAEAQSDAHGEAGNSQKRAADDLQRAAQPAKPSQPGQTPGGVPDQSARSLPNSRQDAAHDHDMALTTQPMSVATGDRSSRAAAVATLARLPAGSLPAGQPVDVAILSGPPRPVLLAADMKNVLLVLKTALAGYLGPGAPLALPDERPAPPRRGVAPAGQKAERATILVDTPPREAAQVLAAETDGALDRVRLLQTAALPEEHRSTTRADNPAPDRLLEIPLRLPGETPVLALAIGPDGRAPVAGEPRGWHMRLSLDLGDAGTIDGYVAVRGPHASVVLSANRQETVQSMRDDLALLRDALSLAHFDIDFLDVRASTPAPPPSVRSGAFLDKSS